MTSGVSQILLYAPNGYYWVDDRYTAQSYLFFALALLVLFVYSRPFSIARLKAWWNSEPEPKGYIKGLEPTSGLGRTPTRTAGRIATTGRLAAQTS